MTRGGGLCVECALQITTQRRETFKPRRAERDQVGRALNSSKKPNQDVCVRGCLSEQLEVGA